MYDISKMIGKTIAEVKQSRSGATILIVFTDGTEVDFAAQDNKQAYPTINVHGD